MNCCGKILRQRFPRGFSAPVAMTGVLLIVGAMDLHGAYIDEYTFTIPNSNGTGATAVNAIDPAVGDYLPTTPGWDMYLLLPQFNRPDNDLVSVEFFLTGDITGNSVIVQNTYGSSAALEVSVSTVMNLLYASDSTMITNVIPTFERTTPALNAYEESTFDPVTATANNTYTEFSDFSRFTSGDVSLLLNTGNAQIHVLDGKGAVSGSELYSQATLTVRYTSVENPTFGPVGPVPEPGAGILAGIVLVTICLRRRRRSRVGRRKSEVRSPEAPVASRSSQVGSPKPRGAYWERSLRCHRCFLRERCSEVTQAFRQLRGTSPAPALRNHRFLRAE